VLVVRALARRRLGLHVGAHVLLQLVGALGQRRLLAMLQLGARRATQKVEQVLAQHAIGDNFARQRAQPLVQKTENALAHRGALAGARRLARRRQVRLVALLQHVEQLQRLYKRAHRRHKLRLKLGVEAPRVRQQQHQRVHGRRLHKNGVVGLLERHLRQRRIVVLAQLHEKARLLRLRQRAHRLERLDARRLVRLEQVVELGRARRARQRQRLAAAGSPLTWPALSVNALGLDGRRRGALRQLGRPSARRLLLITSAWPP
jgi:hypothetical protein